MKLSEQQEDELIELMAAHTHNKSWSGWFLWMQEKWNEMHLSGESFLARWNRQARTDYAKLTEQEKNGDRAEARQYLKIVMNYLNTHKGEVSG